MLNEGEKSHSWDFNLHHLNDEKKRMLYEIKKGSRKNEMLRLNLYLFSSL